MKMSSTVQDLGLRDEFGNVLPTVVWGYGMEGNPAYPVSYPGPTFLAMKNKKVKVTWKNQLPYSYGHLLPVDQTLHWAHYHGYPMHGIPAVTHLHGGHSESASDGIPEAWFTYNFSVKGPDFVKEEYEYKNDQEAGTLWYHDHALGITRLNVYAGLAGFYLLRDKNEMDLIQANILPSGAYEKGIVIQDRMFYANGQLYFPSKGEEDEDCAVPSPAPVPSPSVLPEFFDDPEKTFILVNGKAWPYLDVEPRKYRFRVLNGSDSRFYVLEFDNNMNFYQIGTDVGLLPLPQERNQFIIAPGERFDLVVDFSGHDGENITLLNFGPDEPFRSEDVIEEPANTTTTGLIMQFRVNQPLSATPNATVDANTSLRAAIPALIENAPRRQLVLFEARDQYCRLRPMLGTLQDGSLLWDEPVTENPGLNNTEVWEIYNATMDAHPIHLHLVSFQILNREPFFGMAEDVGLDPISGGTKQMLVNPILSGNVIAPPDNERGWKDTGIVPPGHVMRVIARFDKPGEYVWHCHILSHEDHEMMRPFHVGPLTPGTSLSEDSGAIALEALSQETLTTEPGQFSSRIQLVQNYPNPFADRTEIIYNLPVDADITINIMDMNGKVVRNLFDGFQFAGANSVSWDGRGHNGLPLPGGVYLCQLLANDVVQTMKVMIAR